MATSKALGHRGDEAQIDQRLVNPDLRGVHSLALGSVGVASDDVVVRGDAVEAAGLEFLHEQTNLAPVRSQVDVAERGVELHGLAFEGGFGCVADDCRAKNKQVLVAFWSGS